MKLFSKLVVTSAVIALAFISTANAQSMRIDVPFGFRAGNATLPAGTYKVDLNLTSQRVALSQLDGKASCFLTVKAFDGKGQVNNGSLVFHQYGSSYFLSKVRAVGASTAEMFTTRAERELAKAQPAVRPTTVIALGR